MKASRFVLALAAGAFCLTPPASAILIDFKGNRIGGFLEKDDGTNLTIRILSPDGRERTNEYVRAKVTIIHQVDGKRLAALSGDDPQAYRDYADELARQEADPEASYIAKRLYLIAAHLAPKRLGGTCLVKMSKLAGVTPAEARRYRALAFLLDPMMDPELLKEENTKPQADPIRPDKKSLDDFRKALQHYRTGNFKDLKSAEDTARQDGMVKVFAAAHMDRDKFVKWCEDATCKNCLEKKVLRGKVNAGWVLCPTCNGLGRIANGLRGGVPCTTCRGTGTVKCPECHGTRVLERRPDDFLRVVLRAELWAMGPDDAGDDAGGKGASDSKSWSAILKSGPSPAVRPLSLDTIVPEFDPHKCLYRNGKWVEK